VKDQDNNYYALKCFTEEEEYITYTNVREVAALATLSEHPNIVKIVDVELLQQDRPQWLVMEMMDGNLEQLYRNMNMKERFEVFNSLARQLLDAVSFMHSCDIVHRYFCCVTLHRCVFYRRKTKKGTLNPPMCSTGWW